MAWMGAEPADRRISYKTKPNQMKLPALTICTILLVACQNNNAPLVKGAAKSKKRSGVYIPVVKKGIEGFYTGIFEATRYDNNKEVLDNQITICIDSLDDESIFGHSVVAGNGRPFTASYVRKNDRYEVSAKEPGNDKYDGSYEFSIIPANKTIEGIWNAYDRTIAVTARKYKLNRHAYKYDPAATLPEDMIGQQFYHSTKGEEAESINDDVIRINASKKLLIAKDVENLYKGDLEVIRNAIYARHGYSFKNPRMRTLFDNAITWYMPVSTDVTSLLTETEKKNIAMIKRYEAHAEKYYDVFGR
jgi:hypothetical protein